jgi:hypothetical protein
MEYNVQGTNIPSEWQVMFDRKMMNRTFVQKVTAIREANRIRKELVRSAKTEAGFGRE